MKKYVFISRLLACFFVCLYFIDTSSAELEIKNYFYNRFINDELYNYITQVKNNAEERVNEVCIGYKEDQWYPGTVLLMGQLTCTNSISMAYPGSVYNPAKGGYVTFGNVIVYLTGMSFGQKPTATKIVAQENFIITAIPNLYFQDTFTVTVKVPEGGSTQFLLAKNGIIDIQNISSIYEIENALLKQNKKISRKSLVTEMLEYYKMLKQNQKISSIDFIVSMLTSIEAQNDFIEYVLQKQGGGKK